MKKTKCNFIAAAAGTLLLLLGWATGGALAESVDAAARAARGPDPAAAASATTSQTYASVAVSDFMRSWSSSSDHDMDKAVHQQHVAVDKGGAGAEPSRRFNFLIIGAQKAGTSAMRYVLDKHPFVWMDKMNSSKSIPWMDIVNSEVSCFSRPMFLRSSL